jgi:hypothetical protein
MNEWTNALTDVLALPKDVDARAVLDLARDVAHTVERPAAPITTYLVGVAVGGGMSLDVAAERVRDLLNNWGEQNA